MSKQTVKNPLAPLVSTTHGHVSLISVYSVYVYLIGIHYQPMPRGYVSLISVTLSPSISSHFRARVMLAPHVKNPLAPLVPRPATIRPISVCLENCQKSISSPSPHPLRRPAQVLSVFTLFPSYSTTLSAHRDATLAPHLKAHCQNPLARCVSRTPRHVHTCRVQSRHAVCIEKCYLSQKFSH